VSIDVVHRVSSLGSTVLEDDKIEAVRCHFQVELDAAKELQVIAYFKRFYYAMLPKCQSLPELLHHLPDVVSKLCSALTEAKPVDLAIYFHLISILAKDVEVDLYPCFPQLMRTLSSIVDAVANAGGSPNPELSGKYFECISYLLKFQLKVIVIDAESLREFYGPLLGNSMDFVRQMAAKTFSVVLRKMPPKVFKHHMKLIAASIGQFCQFTSATEAFDACSYIGSESQTVTRAVMEKSLSDLLDGFSVLLFFTLKGVSGQMHSKGCSRLSILFNQLLDVTAKTLSLPLSTKGSSSEARLTVLNECHDLPRLFTSAMFLVKLAKPLAVHVDHQNVTEIWGLLVDSMKRLQDYASNVLNATDLHPSARRCFDITSCSIMELFSVFLTHGSGKALVSLSHARSVQIYGAVMKACPLLVRLSGPDDCEDDQSSGDFNSRSSIRSSSDIAASSSISNRRVRMFERACTLFCKTWAAFDGRLDSSDMLGTELVQTVLKSMPEAWMVRQFTQQLLNSVSTDQLTQYFLGPILEHAAERCAADLQGRRTSTHALDITVLATLRAWETRADARGVHAKCGWSMRRTENGSSPGGEVLSSSGGHIGRDKAPALLLSSLRQVGAAVAQLGHFCLESLAELFDTLEMHHRNKHEGKTKKKSKSGQSQTTLEQGPGISNRLFSKEEEELCRQATLASIFLNWHLQVSPDFFQLFNGGLKGSKTQKQNQNLSKRLRDIISRLWCACAGSEQSQTSATWLGYPLYASLLRLGVTALTCMHSQALASASNGNNGKSSSGGIRDKRSSVDVATHGELADGCRNAIQVLLTAPHASISLLSVLIELLDHQQALRPTFSLDDVLSTEARSAVFSYVCQHLSTPSYWLRISLLRLASFLKPPSFATGMRATSRGNFAPESSDDSDSDSDSDSGLSAESESSNSDSSIDQKLGEKKKMKEKEKILSSTSLPIASMERDHENSFLRMALEAASTPVALGCEREFTRRMDQLAVFVRSEALPQVYIRLLSAFCLGVLSIKFKPFWKSAIDLLVLCNGTDKSTSSQHSSAELWPLLLSTMEFHQSAGTKTANDAMEEEGKKRQDSVLDEQSSGWLSQLRTCDDGGREISSVISHSAYFYFAAKAAQSETDVHLDARTDHETAYTTAWEVLQRCPSITLRRSRVVVPLFLRFLKEEYFTCFAEDPSLLDMVRCGVFDMCDAASDDIRNERGSGGENNVNKVSPRTAKRRMEMFLRVFSAVSSPRQLYLHSKLLTAYRILCSAPDGAVANISLSCILRYKQAGMMPYKDRIEKFLDDRLIRDELAVFDPSASAETIDASHRSEVVPFLVLSLFGRLTSKTKGSKIGRDSSIARRSAILSFYAGLSPLELQPLIYLMLRPILPGKKMANFAQQMNAALTSTRSDIAQSSSSSSSSQQPPQFLSSEDLASWFAQLEVLVLSLSPEDLDDTSWDRFVGFMHLLESAIRLLGLRLSRYVPLLLKMVLLILSHVQGWREAFLEAHSSSSKGEQGKVEEPGCHADAQLESLEMEVDGNEPLESSGTGDGVVARLAAQSTRLRSMALLRLAEMVRQYGSVQSSQAGAPALLSSVQLLREMWVPLGPLVQALPYSISGSSKPPALLQLLGSLLASDSEQTSGIIAERPAAVRALVGCIAVRSQAPVTAAVVTALSHLLELPGAVLASHADLLVQTFARRFTGAKSGSESEACVHGLKLSELDIVPSGSIAQELALLTRLARDVLADADVPLLQSTVANFATILLGLLRTYTSHRKIRTNPAWVVDILQVYRLLLWRIDSVEPHVAFLSRLFGPAAYTLSVLNTLPVRRELFEVRTLLPTPFLFSVSHTIWGL
jgi:hypothetical protein